MGRETPPPLAENRGGLLLKLEIDDQNPFALRCQTQLAVFQRERVFAEDLVAPTAQRLDFGSIGCSG